MDPFPDFGLFEILIATGVAALARRIYVRNMLPYFMLLASVVAPALLIFIADTEVIRWVSAVALATALINAGLLVPLLRRGVLPDVLAEEGRARDKRQIEWPIERANVDDALRSQFGVMSVLSGQARIEGKDEVNDAAADESPHRRAPVATDRPVSRGARGCRGGASHRDGDVLLWRLRWWGLEDD